MSWTAEQRRCYPADLQKLCAGFWSFIDGDDGPPRSRLLPAAVPGSDEVTLVMDVCLLGHMPRDWPDRDARLRADKAILDRADQAGASLHLPVLVESGASASEP